jgi:glycosyltransferase involved in cell wall biosynthesis
MILIIYTSTSNNDLVQRLGRPEYSYRFVVREFMQLLAEFGEVIEVANPEFEVDAIYTAALARGEACLFLCFMPPNKTPFRLQCPTVPVFAWEYESLPNESFQQRPRNDWTRVLTRLGSAITHSSYVVERTKTALGKDFPITSIPAPLWDRMQNLRTFRPERHRIEFHGTVIDSTQVDLSPYSNRALEGRPVCEALPPELIAAKTNIVPLEGSVYTSIFNPLDGRKNWRTMISTFCEALRDCADATLLIKLTHYEPNKLIPSMLQQIHQMGDIRCRILLVHAYLSDTAYSELIHNTTYAVNTSHGEGQCLPLMEYMSAGKPAVAPAHTSMLDYIDSNCAFVVESSSEIGSWPQDQRQAYRTLRQRIHHSSLVDAFRRSYYVAKYEPDTYLRMSEAARLSLKRYCSMDVARGRLGKFLNDQFAAPALQLAKISC